MSPGCQTKDCHREDTRIEKNGTHGSSKAIFFTLRYGRKCQATQNYQKQTTNEPKMPEKVTIEEILG